MITNYLMQYRLPFQSFSSCNAREDIVNSRDGAMRVICYSILVA